MLQAGQLRSILVLVVALAACGSPAPAPSVSAVASTGAPPVGATASPSLAPTPPVSLPPAGWLSGAGGRSWTEPAALASSGRYGSVQAVAAGTDGWVAVGRGEDWEEDASGGLHFLWDRALLWTSADGAAWTAVAHGPEFDRGSMFGVQWTSRGFIAVGSWKDQRPSPEGEPGSTLIYTKGPAAWQSADGLSWTTLPVEQDPDTAEDQGRMNAVVDFDDQVVGVGCLDEGCVRGPAVWLLDRGGRFRRATGVPTEVAAAAFDVIRTPIGLMAVGAIHSHGAEPGRAAVWASADGEVWRRIDGISEAEGGVIRAVSRTPDGLVAVGSRSMAEAPIYPAAWASHDWGATWQEAGVEDFATAAGMDLLDVVYTGRALVAVGRVWEEPWRAVAWVSMDGTRWDRLELPGTGAPAMSIADGPSGVVAVGGYVGGLSGWASLAEDR